MNYNAVVSTIRSLARDILRLRKTAQLRADRYAVEASFDKDIKKAKDIVESYEKEIIAIKKQIAYCDFQGARIEDADPLKEDKLESIKNSKEDYEKHLAALERSLTSHLRQIEESDLEGQKAKELAKFDEKISDVQSGKTKVSQEDLDATTQDLIEEMVPSQFSAELSQALSVPVEVQNETEPETKKKGKKA